MIHTFWGLRFIWATVCSVTLVVIYEIIAVTLIDTPPIYLISSNFFFLSAVSLCMLASYTIELSTRRRFYARHLLMLEKEKVQQANFELDQRVRTRTEELSLANEQLQKEMEQRQADHQQRLELESALNQRQKFEALGTLAGGIAHDFNNILSAIIGYAELVSMDAQPDSLTREHMEKILKASYRARDLTGQILTFSRQKERGFGPFELAPVVKEAMKLIRASIPATIAIDTRIEARSRPCW